MSYSTIMVTVDPDHPDAAHLRLAAELAERFDSRLIGVCAADIQPMYFMEGAAAEDFIEKDRAALKAKIDAAEQGFRRAAQARSRPAEWRGALALPADNAALQARAADLIVAAAPRERIDPLRQVDPGALVLRAGRPVLVIPPQAASLSLKSVVVGWKDTREARRAVADALPLLHKAEQVVVVEIVEAQSDRDAAKARVEDVAAWLTRRGVPTASIATRQLIGVPGQLDVIAQDEGADIIVAGAYGHTRFTEWVFGGVTRDLLRNGKRCALLSH
jgi:nucleotide-binding universal stress UspA family protein